MMEKATSPQTLIVALSYNEDTRENRDAARFFCYADVSDFLKRLRSAAYRKYEPKGGYPSDAVKPWVRFICAGEQGDRRGRCHWHMVLYSNVDLRLVGEVRGKFGPITEPEKMMTTIADAFGKAKKRRLHWDVWGKGFVTFQHADEGGMHYVLSYALKDQFTHEKSKGHGREHKSENFATGLFRPSKFPPIGARWLADRIASLAERGQVLPDLTLPVPGLRGYWSPAGAFRRRLLRLLVACNQRARNDHGRDAPQWSTLLASVQDNPIDLEILTNGFKAEPESDETADDYLSPWTDETSGEIRRDARHTAIENRWADVRRKCGRKFPCKTCLETFSADRLAAFGLTREWGHDSYGNAETRFTFASGLQIDDEWKNPFVGVRNPECLGRYSPGNAGAFVGEGRANLQGSSD